MTLTLDQGIAGVIGGLIGALSTLLGVYINQRLKKEEIFVSALGHLGGGRQRRNIGISVVQHYWDRKLYRPLSVSLLVGSAIYILRAAKRPIPPHELYNLERIFSLLVSDECLARKPKHKEQYQRLLKELETSVKQERGEKSKVPDQEEGVAGEVKTATKEELTEKESSDSSEEPDQAEDMAAQLNGWGKKLAKCCGGSTMQFS